ncbi:MAG: ParA family protein [Thermodesulfobacteriota bacterium]|nr:ParA family protein [Thermodesulfobacteriota bacterium]
MDVKQTRIIAVANEKGGVGKTVTVINLAAALSRLNKTVLVVDMDPQANATRGLGFNPDENGLSVYNLISNPQKVKAATVVRSTPWEGLDLIPSHVDLSGAEVELVDRAGRENSLKTAMETINGSYDFILIDTPPSLSLLTVNVMAYAREVIIPCQTHPYAFAALAELFDTIDAVKSQINPDLKITGIVPTFVDLRTRVSNLILKKLKEDENTRGLLFKTMIRTNTTIADSAVAGKPVVFYRAGAYGTIDYSDLAEELVERNASA